MHRRRKDQPELREGKSGVSRPFPLRAELLRHGEKGPPPPARRNCHLDRAFLRNIGLQRPSVGEMVPIGEAVHDCVHSVPASWTQSGRSVKSFTLEEAVT